MDEKTLQHIANVLSTITILSCFFLKFPQINYIREKESAEGIYVQALMMEICGFSITTLYNYTNNYCLMTYLEYPVILIQVYVILYYVLKYKNLLQLPVVPICVIMYVCTVLAFMVGALPKNILSFLVPLCTPLSGFAKVTYIYGIIHAANADAVSLTTWTLSVATNLSRVFTVFVDSRDVKLITNFVISALLSSGVMFTALYYKRKTRLTTPRQRHLARFASRRRSHQD